MSSQPIDPAAPAAPPPEASSRYARSTPRLPTTAPSRAYVGGAYWWTHAVIDAVFASSDGRPCYLRTFEEALAKARACDGRVVAWASRLEASQEAAARDAGVELWRIEDGFVRSIGLGAGFAVSYSIAVDRHGMHYDSARASDLEMRLQELNLDDTEIARGRLIRQRLIAARLSKYNLQTRGFGPRRPRDREVVLVPGQVSDDRSILTVVSTTIDPGARSSINEQLLAATRARRPDAHIIYKPHPDVAAGLRRGQIAPAIVHQYADAVEPNRSIIDLIDECDRVETISSLTGFEALIREKPVTVHGQPFYAGWGLTDDVTPNPNRTRRRSIDELVYIAFAIYTRHIDPKTHRICEFEVLLDALAAQKASRITYLRNAAVQPLAWLFAKLGL